MVWHRTVFLSHPSIYRYVECFLILLATTGMISSIECEWAHVDVEQ